MKRYLVLTLRRPRIDPAVLAPHYAHLAQLRERGQLELAGPSTDASGGAYLIRASDLDAACAVANADPLHVTGASEVRVYEWDAR